MLRVTASLCLALLGCVESGDEGMYIIKNAAVGESCVATADPAAPYLGHGSIYYGSDSAYVMTPIIQSRLVSDEGADMAGRTIQTSVQHADGSFSDNGSLNTSLGGVSTLFSGVVSPGGTTGAVVEIIPPATLRNAINMAGGNLLTEQVRAELLAEVVIRGEVNGDSIETPAYFYPVTVCNDCSVNIVGDCPMTGGTPREGTGCNPFQDGSVIDCCRESTGALTCPARTL
jgi:hypothetical protein